METSPENAKAASKKEDLRILQGHALAYFAFDIGYEVDLGKVNQLLTTQPVQPISRTKKTPNYLQYAKPPQIVPLGQTDILFDTQFEGQVNPQPSSPDLTGASHGNGKQGKGQIQATIFDFGAVSISFRWPLAALAGLQDKPEQGILLETLPIYSKQLFETNLEAEAWHQVERVMERIRPAISRPHLSSLIEDYYVFIIETLSQPLLAQELMTSHNATLAKILRFETQPLSVEHQRDTLSKAVSYYEDDLALIDWNASLIFDTDYADTLNVLELMNVELLEARYMDAELDKRIDVYEETIAKKPSHWFLPLWNPYRKTIGELAALRIEAALLAERVENALKLIGDLYLARIHTAACERFSISAWDEAISRKLTIIGNLYQLLTDRISTTQGQTLEMIIILLILIEILLNITPH
ncbi:MAG: hypothetical protein VKJ04_06995 [Vampirovibrionales bacterium]|nr:hypothetical protein [Vampirovibrionales bacterium]